MIHGSRTKDDPRRERLTRAGTGFGFFLREGGRLVLDDHVAGHADVGIDLEVSIALDMRMTGRAVDLDSRHSLVHMFFVHEQVGSGVGLPIGEAIGLFHLGEVVATTASAGEDADGGRWFGGGSVKNIIDDLSETVEFGQGV